MMNDSVKTIVVQLKSESDESFGNPFDIPVDISSDKLQLICNALLQNEKQVPYLFFANDIEITKSLKQTIESNPSLFEFEKCLDIVCAPQAVFHVQAVSRCTSSIAGHSDAVVSVQFSPDGTHLASGSGDTTVRFWDVTTETPKFTCSAHRNWVLAIAWSPNGQRLASADKSGIIYIWDPKTGKQIGSPLSAHKQWVNSMSWEPFHFDPDCRRLASASKDCSVRIWDTVLQKVLFTINGHLQSVTCVKWGGSGLIYTASQDRTVKVWRSDTGILCRTLEGHAHWVNTLALSTDYVMRTAAFDPAFPNDRIELNTNIDLMVKNAKQRYQLVRNDNERLVSGSDDFTLFLWFPEKDKKCLSRMTGHQQLINDVKFSPDARIIASASFDKSIKLWDGKNGKFITSLRGHVKAVYQISWSADNRLLVSGSADSTLKVWDIIDKKLMIDLPGHADEVYAIDWSPDGERVASGGKDKVLKLWKR
ncbi:notchless protein homolog 1-like [Oppia nitens]|uniref:notchless protein homolog 1-like n=1 Tax=Oppia nitens TaxID=1686743 RepID=UPI0023DA1265|nr:notchless protein homolog 1-like [Oppia nitens]